MESAKEHKKARRGTSGPTKSRKVKKKSLSPIPAEASHTSPNPVNATHFASKDANISPSIPSPGMTSETDAHGKSDTHPDIFSPKFYSRRGTRIDLQDMKWNAVAANRRPSMHAVDAKYLSPGTKSKNNIDPALADMMSGMQEISPVAPASPPGEKEKPENEEKRQLLAPRTSIFRILNWTHGKHRAEKKVSSNMVEQPKDNKSALSPEHLENAIEHVAPKPAGADTPVDANEPNAARSSKRAKKESEVVSPAHADKEKKSPQRKQSALITGLTKIWVSMSTKRKGGGRTVQREPLTKSEIIAVSSSVILILTIPTVIIFVILSLLKPETATIFDCSSSKCIQVKNNLASMLNTRINPCTDFYSYVCDKWMRNHTHVSYIEYVIEEFHRSIHSALYEGSPEPTDRHGMHLLSRLYRTCYKFMTSSNLTLQEITSYASEELEIPLLLNASNSGVILKYLVNVSLSRGVSSVFSLHFENKDRKPYLYVKATRSIQGYMENTIHEAVPKDLSYSFIPHIEDYVKDVTSVIYEGKDTDSHVRQMVEWDRTFDVLLMRVSVEGSEEYRRIAEMTEAFNPVKMSEITAMINSMAPQRLALSTEKDSILAYGFPAIVQILDTMKNGTVAARSLYFAVQLLTNVLSLFNLRQHLVAAPPDIIVTACLRVTQQTLFHTWPYLVTRKMHYSARAAEAKRLADSIKNFPMEGGGLNWTSDASARGIIRELNNLDIVTYEDSALHNMQSTYDGLQVGDNSFLIVYFKIKRFETRLLLDWLPTTFGTVAARNQIASNLSLQHFQAGSTSWIFIPSAYQSPAMFKLGEKEAFPFYINHPTIGLLVAREMIRVTQQAMNWDERTRRVTKRYMDCLTSIRSFLRLEAIEEENKWRTEAFSWSFGSHLSYTSMRIAFQQHSKVDTTQFRTAQELYFILSCLMSCSSVESGLLFLSREQCAIPLLSNVDFLRYYNCTEIERLSCITTLFVR
ncbi:uncharacterized protein LOC135400069 [Ornithodoros turicata]|uniref:uncharacterized protein LOC135400069 n=1 Tax=Ornithodoros turicata TaxID=34597 RepID=UPI003138E10F